MTPAPLRCIEVGYDVPGSDGQPRPVLRGLDAEFAPGSIAVVGGPTGAGKSTLLHLLAGLVRPTSGTIYAGADPVSRWTAGRRDRWRRAVGLAFQWSRAIADLGVLDNAMAPLVPRGYAAHELRERGRSLLARCDLAGREGLPAGALSGGERQRLELARALAAEPAYLLLDEPTASQDRAGFELVADLIEAEQGRGASIVIASHDHGIVERLAPDRVFELIDGTAERRS